MGVCVCVCVSATSCLSIMWILEGLSVAGPSSVASLCVCVCEGESESD